MSETVVSIENLSKVYRVGHRSKERERHPALRDVIAREVRNFARKAADIVRGNQIVQGDEIEEFWALRDISFEVKQGEVLGILGRNGAGKSTLLKILSRITEPTGGRAVLKGRVASLLEVGTGFHPELTGRENVYLNGAILGMGQKEIAQKFDEIVAFAEVDKFIDTPVKHYSSGMYVRLAFAVAAHLEPEILVVDEVLAVGDTDFQKKCLGKLDQASRREGRTVIFVSHNMAALSNLCSKGIYLHQGQLQQAGDITSVLSNYLSASQSGHSGHVDLIGKQDREGSQSVYFTSASILTHEGLASSQLQVTKPFKVRLCYTAARQISEVELVLRIETFDGITIFSSTHLLSICHKGQQGKGYVEIPAMFLMPGSYSVTIVAHTPMVEFHDVQQRILDFDVVDDGSPFALYGNYRSIGLVMADLAWRVETSAL
jgi:lipopolysaccharide transport system ATP-binding protein